MKTSYKLDKNNKLTIIKDNLILKPLGDFIVDDDNQLAYEIAESVDWRKEYDLPEKITLKGKWQIDAACNLIYTLQKSETQAGSERLLLKSELVQAKANALIFSLGTKGRSGTHGLRFLQLKGKWQADKHNRLQFVVKKLNNVLTLQGSWQVKNNTLIYTYRKTALKTKIKKLHTLRFSGYWQINKKNQITYILDTKSNSSFVFKTYLETPSLIGKKGVIKYRVGIGIKGSKLFKTEVITLYGVWKFQRKTGLSLDIDYGDGRVKAITFGAFARFNKQSKATFKLKTRDGKDLGLSLEFSRTFLKNNAEWFLRAVSEEKHPRFECGITMRW